LSVTVLAEVRSSTFAAENDIIVLRLQNSPQNSPSYGQRAAARVRRTLEAAPEDAED
jgi:hypothetical protein